MNARFDCPFPAAWTADELADSVSRPVSSLFVSGIPLAPDATRRSTGARLRTRPLDRGLPVLFRVR
ncbi:hypothetical protein [Luteimonas deserti]|uniref:Uncharacterized protein n=1 Tax=Luteimonas deserti TaxID=2752306 RepID=A0A7Z0QUA5_9GAMM|nr:hypothetical protein [Luteimonas deserti]NYZ63558.1 hypothetical protein [Luteimonas deserti]